MCSIVARLLIAVAVVGCWRPSVASLISITSLCISSASIATTMALPKPLITAYVALIAVLVYRAIYYPAALPSPPSKSTRRCTFDWRRARCSAGCTFKVMGGCKPTDAAAPPSAPAVDVSQADSLMRKRTVANCLAAADIYEAAAGPEATTGPARQLQLVRLVELCESKREGEATRR